MRRILFVFFVIIALGAIMFYGCSESTSENDDNGDTFTVTIIQPVEGDTVIGTLTINAECEPTPDYVEFTFDTFVVEDNESPYSASFDMLFYCPGNYSISAVAHLGEQTASDYITRFLYIECDPDEPVVLNGITIPEGRIERGAYECVTEIDLSEYNLSDPNCLAGIEVHIATLQKLNKGYNRALTSIDLSPISSFTRLEHLSLNATSLTSIDLSPLAGCTNLWILNIHDSGLESIDLTPLATCTNFGKIYLSANPFTLIDLSPLATCNSLERLDIFYNQLETIDLTPLWDLNIMEIDIRSDPGYDAYASDSASCASICEFADGHPNSNVQHDCDCEGE